MTDYGSLIKWCEQEIAELRKSIEAIENGHVRHHRKVAPETTFTDTTDSVLDHDKATVTYLEGLVTALRAKA
ncbi:MAG: hypothetical protein JNK47_02780 [Mesorhizobium sp.]|nr:hypothetical protein [Mesorhizobium sp.]MBL8576125.1 hypothetical protein [Mesorhizobium sp.]